MAGITGALVIGILVFMLLMPVFLLFSEMWSVFQPAVTNQMGNTTAGANQITQLGNSFFYYTPDSMLALLYFGLILALFISAIYENATPESLPIGLLFLIPLILITFPLSDFTHAFYSNPGFANIAQYYSTTEYLSDWSPMFTIIFTVAYLVVLVTKKQVLKDMPGGGNIVSG